MDIVNPATGDRIDSLAEATPAEVAAAYAAARAAQPAWAAQPPAERTAVLRRFRDLVADRAEDLAGVLTAETGKPITQARNELAATVPRLDFFLDHAEDAVADQWVATADDTGGTEEIIRHEPLGVVANISAWNYPWFVGTNVFVPALLTGNAVLYKPSEHASLTGRAIAALLAEAGVPDDLLALLVGAGPVGAALIDQPVDAVFFTGSHTTGRRIAGAIAGRMIRLQLELGGKDPVYVCDDVDVVTAAEALADGAFYNAGQSCCSVERIYVHDAVHDTFVEHFVKAVESFVAGDPSDDATYLGPLTRPEQIAVLDAQVADALAHGASVRTGGRPTDDGRGYRPTVLTEVTSSMAVMRDESFGPIIGIQRVTGDDEAVARMNDTDYGLTAGVFTADEERATNLLRQVDAGSAYWNCCDRVSPRLPWSGRRNSGIGLTLSVAGIQAFTRPKAWHLRRPT